MSEPTARPWAIDGHDNFNGWQFILITAKNGTYKIAEVQPNDAPNFNGRLTKEDRANAAHIVKAVNMHEELIEFIRSVSKGEYAGCVRDSEVVTAASALLVKAEAP